MWNKVLTVIYCDRKGIITKIRSCEYVQRNKLEKIRSHKIRITGCINVWEIKKKNCKIRNVKGWNLKISSCEHALCHFMHIYTLACCADFFLSNPYNGVWARRSWKDKLKCAEVQRVKDHNLSKIWPNLLISLQAHLHLCWKISTV